MPFEGITQIPYQPRGEKIAPLSNQQVNDLLLYGKPYVTQYAKAIHLRRANAPFKQVPCIAEYMLMLEGKKQKDDSDPRQLDGRLLQAQFRPDHPGIEYGFSRADIESQPKRQIAAYSTSMVAGVEIIPIAVKRDFSYLQEQTEMSNKNPLAKLALAGPGTLTAMVKGEPLFIHDFNIGKRCVREDILFKRKTFVAALLFDMLIGSGQRDANSYLIDEDGRVRTVYHHEAFTFTAQEHLCEHLEQEYPEVAAEFWKALKHVKNLAPKRDRLVYELSKHLQDAEIERFLSLLNLLLNNQRVCGQEIVIG